MIRAAVSSRPPASPSPLPAEGWLVIDRLGEGARRGARPGQGEEGPQSGHRWLTWKGPPSLRHRDGFPVVSEMLVTSPSLGRTRRLRENSGRCPRAGRASRRRRRRRPGPAGRPGPPPPPRPALHLPAPPGRIRNRALGRFPVLSSEPQRECGDGVRGQGASVTGEGGTPTGGRGDGG